MNMISFLRRIRISCRSDGGSQCSRSEGLEAMYFSHLVEHHRTHNHLQVGEAAEQCILPAGLEIRLKIQTVNCKPSSQ
jgi:hypothetical protein